MFLAHQHGLMGPVTADVVHAISMHHGGWAPLARAENQLRLSPLATILHAADLMSASAQNGDVD